MITLLNLKNSNLQSVINALDFIGAEYTIVDSAESYSPAEKLILPGVGNFGVCMDRMKESGLFDLVRTEVLERSVPILGICLGMQMLFDNSEECPGAEGLGLIKGSVVKLAKSPDYRLPRVGWAESTLQFDFLGLEKDEVVDFYYIHSYHAMPEDGGLISIKTENNITSAVQREHIYGCQFHPEKSHKAGLKILETFSNL